MIALALDTSGPVGSVALRRDGRLVAERTLDTQQHHSSLLLPTIDELLRADGLAPREVGLWVVGLGPGSYTGIRVGIAAAKGFAVAWGRPLVGAGSVEALALEHGANRSGAVAVVVDARRGEVYFSLAVCGKTVAPLQIITLDALPDLVTQQALFVGPEIKRYQPDIARLLGERALFPTVNVHPRAAFVGELGERRFAEQGRGDEKVEPVYLRPTNYVKARQ
ncbi:MAG: tRNA (adenosine(37)-N6)-threonylcarbamoyltransferase complex dimerization subunit type 1 TsaB [Verrucomicrobiae bacterium]|nr:tRNA (adenosine(37)-N6)-threonylcarbamoyltransferase complex dimerization subunit type 1 TsaB [Verrucomicrobiae bacterium]